MKDDGYKPLSLKCEQTYRLEFDFGDGNWVGDHVSREFADLAKAIGEGVLEQDKSSIGDPPAFRVIVTDVPPADVFSRVVWTSDRRG